MSEKKDNCTDTENVEEKDSFIEKKDDNSFTFVRSVSEDSPVTKSGMSEEENLISNTMKVA